MESQEKKYKTGVALGGGGVRGIAHIGALKAIQEKGINIDIVSGCSAGSIIGVFFADGYSPDEIKDIFFNHKLFQYIKMALPKKGLFKMTGLKNVLKQYLRSQTMEELKIPLIINATELNRGRCIYFTEGKIIKKVIASSTLPIIFEPVEIDGKTYIDGGVYDILPVKPLLDICQAVIGVHVSPKKEYENFDSMYRVAERTFQLSVEGNAKDSLKLCDIPIQPKELANYSFASVNKFNEIFTIGYEEASKVLDDINLDELYSVKQATNNEI